MENNERSIDHNEIKSNKTKQSNDKNSLGNRKKSSNKTTAKQTVNKDYYLKSSDSNNPGSSNMAFSSKGKKKNASNEGNKAGGGCKNSKSCDNNSVPYASKKKILSNESSVKPIRNDNAELNDDNDGKKENSSDTSLEKRNVIKSIDLKPFILETWNSEAFIKSYKSDSDKRNVSSLTENYLKTSDNLKLSVPTTSKHRETFVEHRMKAIRYLESLNREYNSPGTINKNNNIMYYLLWDNIEKLLQIHRRGYLYCHNVENCTYRTSDVFRLLKHEYWLCEKFESNDENTNRILRNKVDVLNFSLTPIKGKTKTLFKLSDIKINFNRNRYTRFKVDGRTFLFHMIRYKKYSNLCVFLITNGDSNNYSISYKISNKNINLTGKLPLMQVDHMKTYNIPYDWMLEMKTFNVFPNGFFQPIDVKLLIESYK